jgi:hypothetical protein
VLREARGIRKNKTGDKVADAKPSASDKAEKIAGKGHNALGQHVLGQNHLGQAKDASRGPAKEADRR